MSDALKALAGRAAAERVEDGMRVGLGTGTTARHAILRLGERVAEGLRMVGIPTSFDSERIARSARVPIGDFDSIERLDIAIDGADEVDLAYHLTKGGGGALLREKVVAAAAARFVVVVEARKLVARLGESFPLPIEIVPFARRPVERALTGLGGSASLRMAQDAPVLTDNGNWLLDVRFAGGIADPAALETAIDRIPGVVESGLFVGLATELIIGRDGGLEFCDLGRR